MPPVQSPQYGPYNPQQAQPDPNANLFAQLLAHLGNQQQPAQPDFAKIIAAARAPKQSLHLGLGGAPITNENPSGNAGGDPFTNGFFRSAVSQQGQPGYQNPFAHMGSVLTGTSNAHMTPELAQMSHMTPGTPTPWTMPGQNLPGVSQGMINPRLPDARKYTDQNFWSALGNFKPGTANPQSPKYFGFPKTPFQFEAPNAAPFSFGGSSNPKKYSRFPFIGAPNSYNQSNAA